MAPVLTSKGFQSIYKTGIMWFCNISLSLSLGSLKNVIKRLSPKNEKGPWAWALSWKWCRRGLMLTLCLLICHLRPVLITPSSTNCSAASPLGASLLLILLAPRLQPNSATCTLSSGPFPGHSFQLDRSITLLNHTPIIPLLSIEILCILRGPSSMRQS